MNLFEVATEYKLAYDTLTAMDDINEDIIKDSLAFLSDELESKAINTAAYIKNLEAEADAVRSAKENMQARLSKLERVVASLKFYLRDAMMASGVSTITRSPLFEVRLKKNPPSVSIVDEQALPDVFFKKKEVVQIDKDSIGKMLKAGEPVPGAELKQDMRLVIK